MRWEKDAGGPSRVRVSPELVQVSTASTKWQAPFDAPLTDVFRVQADMAARVAEALGVALGAGERERLGERPTREPGRLRRLPARARRRPGDGDRPVALRRAIDYYERAVALDSSFALAWAQLSRAHSSIYLGRALRPPAATAARRAAERALALAPKLPEGYLRPRRLLRCVQHDLARALEQYARARQLAPKDARLLAVAG